MSLIILIEPRTPPVRLQPGDKCDCVHGERRDEPKLGKLVASFACLRCGNAGTVLPVEQQGFGGVPRRCRADLLTPAERAIREAVLAVETLPADSRLTQAVILLQQAREHVADYVEDPKGG